jgi:NAD(P)-dependent dehydrogenase (short-subunit alcohol dehydrogenase family)
MAGRMDGKVAFVTGAARGQGRSHGRLDVIVANAGIGTTAGKLHKTDEALWQEMIDVNLSGVWKTVMAGVPHVLAGGRGGSIVLTSSGAGFKAYPHMGHSWVNPEDISPCLAASALHHRRRAARGCRQLPEVRNDR